MDSHQLGALPFALAQATPCMYKCVRKKQLDSENEQAGFKSLNGHAHRH